MPQTPSPPTGVPLVRTPTSPDWTQEPLFPLTDESLRKSAFVRLGVFAVLNGSTGIQEIGYEIVDLSGDRTLALAHNVIPGCPWDQTQSFSDLAGQQHTRAKRLLLPF